MVGRGAILTDGGTMSGGGIAFVLVPMVLGIILMDAEHVVVAVGLGKNGGGGDVHVGGVALDDGGMGDVFVGHEAVAVDEEVLGTDAELRHGTVHGEDAGAEDVYLVDFLVGDHAHSPGKGFALDDFTQLVAVALGELLGVIQQVVLEILRQDDGSGIDGACKASAAGLVAAGFDSSFL